MKNTNAAALVPVRVEITRSANYEKNQDRARLTAGLVPCAVCAKACNQNTARWVHECAGGGFAYPADVHGDSGEAGCLGLQAVGPDCWKIHPELHPFEVSEATAA